MNKSILKTRESLYKWEPTAMKEAVTGVFDYLICDNRSLFHCDFNGLSLYIFLFIYVMACVLCWISRILFICIFIWTKEGNVLKSWAEGSDQWKAVMQHTNRGNYLEFHWDLLNLCCSCNCTHSQEGKDIGGWQTGAGMYPARALLWDPPHTPTPPSPSLQVSFTWLHNGWTLEGNGCNNCTGNYSIKRSIHPPTSPPSGILSFFSLYSMQCVGEAAELGGGGVREQSGLGVPWPGHLAGHVTAWPGGGEATHTTSLWPDKLL